jgi:type III pantothenate kinase
VCAELVADIGHSRIKWGLCADGRLDPDSVGEAPAAAPDALFDLLELRPIGSCLLSGQSRPEVVARIAERIRQAGTEVDIISTGDRPLPVPPSYAGLGCDRWLAVQWPWHTRRRAFAVIDCGTAITVDLVDDDGRHRGGWIMAGIEAGLGGLFGRAPALERPLPAASDLEAPALETAPALSRGALLLAAGGIERAVRAAERAAGGAVECWLTGGDAARIRELLDETPRYERHLVLHGLAMATQVT